MTETATSTAPAVKIGDAVQILQYEGISTATQNATREKFNCDATPEHWIYATVVELVAPDSVRVLVNHPGNYADKQQQIVPAGRYRTAADVAALLAAQQQKNAARPTPQGEREAKHLANQLKKLQPDEAGE
jgi:hypothetical protein